MSSKDWRVRVEDMLEAIARIGRYVEGVSTADFLADDRTQDAVIRNLEILGEASKRIPAAITQRTPGFPGRASPTCATYWCMNTTRSIPPSSSIPPFTICRRWRRRSGRC